jgi:hypothetical protein
MNWQHAERINSMEELCAACLSDRGAGLGVCGPGTVSKQPQMEKEDSGTWRLRQSEALLLQKSLSGCSLNPVRTAKY